jgi:hypothetical protein
LALDASGVSRVVALYRAGGDWQSAELVSDAGTFVGTLTVPSALPNEAIRVVVQVVDGAGNVSWAGNKGPGFSPVPPPPPGPDLTLSPAPPASGWYSGVPQVSIAPQPGTAVEVSIDGGPASSYTGPFVPAGLGNGLHIVTAIGSDGGLTVQPIQIDSEPPVVTIALTPPANAAGWRNVPVSATFTCSDTGSGVERCPDDASTEQQEGASITISGEATDRVGRSATASASVNVDLSPPSTPTVTLAPPSTTIGSGAAISVSASDLLSGVVGGEWWIGDDPGAGAGTALAPGTLTGETDPQLAVGEYTVSARVIDAAGNWSSIGTAGLTVSDEGEGENTPPSVTTPATVTGEEGTPIGVSATAGDGDGDPLTFEWTVSPAPSVDPGATCTIGAQAVTTTITCNDDGQFTLTLTVDDGMGGTESDSTTVTVSNVAPSVAVSSVPDSPVQAGVSLDVVADVLDSGSNDSWVCTVDWGDGSSSAGVRDGDQCRAAHAYASQGSKSIVFSVVDDDAGTGTATTSVSVGNQSPIVEVAEVTTAEDVPSEVTMAASDPDGDPLSYVVVSYPSHGTLSGTGATRTYTPDPNYHGPDSFMFSVGDGISAPVAATVAIIVTPVNDPPVANPTTATVASGQSVPVTLAGSDVDGDSLTVVVVTQPLHGTLTAGGGGYSYTSTSGYSGSDSLAFAVHDGTVQSEPATVAITVTPTTATMSLQIASDANRSANVRALDGATLSGGSSAYIFVGGSGSANVSRVAFTLDGRPFSIDSSAPFDFAGTSNYRACRRCQLAAYPFESNLLSIGQHVVTATVTRSDGSSIVLAGTFTVAATQPHSLLVSTSRTRSSPTPLADAVLRGRRYIFLGPANDAISGATSVVFRLDGRTLATDSWVPYDAAGTGRGGYANAIDTTRLRNGFHRLTATVKLAGGAQFTYDVQFRVAN